MGNNEAVAGVMSSRYYLFLFTELARRFGSFEEIANGFGDCPTSFLWSAHTRFIIVCLRVAPFIIGV